MEGSWMGEEGRSNSPFKSGTLKDECWIVLSRAGPTGLRVQQIVREIQLRRVANLGGNTPANTICAALSSADSIFVRVAPGTYALEELALSGRGLPSTHTKQSPRSPLSSPFTSPTGTGQRSLKKKRGEDGDTTPWSARSLDKLEGSGKNGFRTFQGMSPRNCLPSPSSAPSPSPSEDSVGAGLVTPMFDELLSQRDACVAILVRAGSQGMSVGDIVSEIRRRQLAKLVGRTPHNSITRCLSADKTFSRVGPGRYALANPNDAVCLQALALLSERVRQPSPSPRSVVNSKFMQMWSSDEEEFCKEAQWQECGETPAKMARKGNNEGEQGDRTQKNFRDLEKVDSSIPNDISPHGKNSNANGSLADALTKAAVEEKPVQDASSDVNLAMPGGKWKWKLIARQKKEEKEKELNVGTS